MAIRSESAMILRDLSAFNMGRGAYDTTGVKKPVPCTTTISCPSCDSFLAASGFGFYIFSNHAFSVVDLIMERHGHYILLRSTIYLHTHLIRRHEPAQVDDLFHQK
ncbi:uncharacterized protein BO80DRAFT_444308 [Aspergillus ibericus CBS 121593]|uniref:Uncharacterized protein n=1 Tax=Aspergillus ibericus CBS 121593 TaxID=1448316 RepID=A0A395H1S3_9EURO|nr:hypothetical protein BO80DRAFT_444308 [Aspergillus ibericus CBS 121593]RAL01613.1 hypothetical protein BO80DRAFT_444308 [Aspergillus ibericus CBS 121593]